MKDVDNSGSIISQYDYTYDPSGNLTEEKRELGVLPRGSVTPLLLQKQDE